MSKVTTGEQRAVAGPVAPGGLAKVALRPLSGGSLRLDGGFWGERQVLNREVTVPHGMAMLEEHGNLDNLRRAAQGQAVEYPGVKFGDSDVYKVLEAIAWERQHGEVPEHERFYGATAALLAAAQMPDGYLNSYFQVVAPGQRFSEPAMGHELYCAGHLFQAAVAEARSGGGGSPPRRQLAPVAERLASCVGTAMRERPWFVPGHPEVEMALVEMYRSNGQGQLLALAEELVGRRGQSRLEWESFGPEYFQDDVEVAKAQEIRGHAVRALYLLSGAADLYMETGKPELLRSCLSQWDDMAGSKTYLTGGVGSRHEDEAFGAGFELPAESAYCETCAAVGSIMWNWRMLLITGEARFAELLERTLYNGFLAGWGLDGRSFFYVNPLRSRGDVSRQPWYRCACCPPNVMRLVASLEHYVATRTADGLQLHQFMACSFRQDMAGGWLAGRVATEYPYEGTVRVLLEEAPTADVEIALRVPSWARELEVSLNGTALAVEPGKIGYITLRRGWRAGDELVMSFPLRTRVVRADPRIEDANGCVAFERGPLVYCFEQLGQEASSLDGLAVPASPGAINEQLAHVGPEPTVELAVTGRTWSSAARDRWPYSPTASKPDGRAQVLELHAVPYYTWANRGPSQMRVWVPELSR
ncbi:MAG: glycoside hydrolase family 127 protein [Acidimicrobiales bacterium]